MTRVFESHQGRDYFLSPLPPDQLWGPPSLLPNGYWELFPQVMKLTTHLHLAPSLRIHGAMSS